MTAEMYKVDILPKHGYWVAYVNGEFFCSADSFLEAVKEVESVYG